ncbi:MAG: hemolysin family protein [Candidatus Omnitrophota bacterium]
MNLLYHIPLVIVFLLLLALISFFFSLSETAIIALSKIKLRHMVSRGSRRALSVQRLLMMSDRFITAILVGNNFVNIAISSVIAAIFVKIFGADWGVIVATFVSTLFILIACEIIPKMLALKHTEKTALFVSPLLEGFIRVFDPVIRVFSAIGNGVLRILRIETPKRSPLITEEELRLMIEVGKEEGVLTDEERKMLHRIFEFGDIKVRDVMVPLDKMVSLNVLSTLEDVLNMFAEQGHARLPVYKDSPDAIVGIMYARDVLYMLNDKQLFVLQDLLHAPYFVPSSMRVSEILRRFQVEKIQIAVVVDENTKAVGMVTLEDLIEEIVGEIEESPSANGRHRRKKREDK